MKKLFALALVLCVIASPSMASNGSGGSKKAESSKNFSIVRGDDNTFMFQVNTVEPGFVKVKIYSENNQLIHEKSISYNHSVKVPFDFSNLEEGNYKFAVEGPDVRGTQDIFLSKMHEKDVAAFIEDLGEDKVKLTVYHDDTPITVTLVDGRGNKYFDKSLKLEKNFVQVFDLSDVKEENMMVVIRGTKTTVSKAL